MTVDEVRAALRLRYSAPAWAFFEEVPDATGFGWGRRADAIAFGVWPSQGLELHGFEIKASRGDWLRERKKPEKAEEVMGYCDRVWIVTCHKGLVNLEELPPTWGLIEPHGAGLRATKAAEKNPEARPFDRSFTASVMRQAFRYIETEIANADVTKAAYDKGYKLAEQLGAANLENTKEHADQLERAIQRFEEASGVRISSWDAGSIGQAVRAVLSARDHNFQARLLTLQQDINRAVARFTNTPPAEDEPTEKQVLEELAP